MPLSITITRSWNFPAGRPVTLAALRLGALPSVSIAGAVGTGEIADGAVTPPKVTPGAYSYAELTGTNTYSGTWNPAVTAYVDGLEVLGRIGNTNTLAATATLEANGLGPKNIYHRNGQLVKPADLVAFDIVRFRYNMSRATHTGGWDVMEVLPSATIRPAVNVTAGTAALQTVVNVPPLTGYSEGLLLLVKVGVDLTNTGPLMLDCDGIGSRSVLLPGGVALPAGSWKAGNTYLLYDDGTQFVLLNEQALPAIVASTRNLTIQSISTTQVTVTADEAILKYLGTGHPLLVQGVNLTVDITLGVALNGFESGAARVTNRWFYVWLISNGTTAACVLEDSGSGGAAPAGPDLSVAAFTGYKYQALVGQVRLNAVGLGEVVTMYQHDRRVSISEVNIFTAKAVTTANVFEVLAGTLLTEDLGKFRAAVPPTAVRCHGTAGASTSNSGNIMLSACGAAGAADTAALGAVNIVLGQASGAVNSFFAAAMFDVPVRGGVNYNIQWRSSGALANNRLNIAGFTF